MMNKNTAITITYSDSKLRVLVEEYITMQKHDFTFKSLCSYVLYRAMEEEKTANTGLYESNQLAPSDCERLKIILNKNIVEGRITFESVTITDETKFKKNID